MTIALTLVLTALVTAFAFILANNLIPTERKVKHHLPHRYTIADPQFERTVGQLLGPPILAGNRVDILCNGHRIFPAMHTAIRAARRSITLESYIWRSGQVTDALAGLLAASARKGIKVHVLLDAAGCSASNGQAVRLMKEAGAEVTIYHVSNVARFNFRTHRKLLVVDGTVGFIGGAGFADEWIGDADAPDHWRDNHYRLTGPAVAQVQAAFNDNWMKASGRVLDGEDYFPALHPAGSVHCQVFKSSPQDGGESARLMFLLSIAAAARSIHIGNAYFVPDDLTVETLLQARARGVEIQVLVPGPHQDSTLVRRACRERSGRLLAAGVRMFEYLPTMYHCKCMIVDELWCSVGSSNFDNRSLRLNDEANLDILDARLAGLALAMYNSDLTQARELHYSEWLARPWHQKLGDKLCALARSQI